MGGGLAGLALAAELSALEFSHLSIIVIEPRDEYLRDKTWSYWRPNQQDNVPHDFSDCESAIWPVWCVKDATNSVSIDSSKAENYVYASIASDTFYRAALAKINACMDALFLSFLQKNAALGSHAFVRLFSNCAPASLIQFLTGQANWRDRLAVIRSIL